MPIGSSDGQYYENRFEAMVGSGVTAGLRRIPIVKEENPDIIPGTDPGDEKMVLDPQVMQQNRQLDKIEVDPAVGIGLEVGYKTPSTDSTMPLGSPTEPAGALNQEGGRVVPGNEQNTNIDWSKLNQPMGEIKGTAPEDTPVVARAAGGIKITEGDIDRAINVGMGGGPGTMMGVKSKIFDKNALAHAQIMLADGVHPEDVFRQTGVFKGRDGRWRQEIDDSKSVFKQDWAINQNKEPSRQQLEQAAREMAEEAYKQRGDKFATAEEMKMYREDPLALVDVFDRADFNKKFPGWDFSHGSILKPTALSVEKSVKLPEVLDHPELYQAYPQLKSVNVRYDPSNPSAHWDINKNEIVVGEHFKGDKGTLYHEIQHAVQDIEGFAKGTFPGQASVHFRLKLEDAILPVAKRLRELYHAGKKRNLDEHEFAEKNYLTFLVQKFNEYAKAATDEAYNFYMKSAGETEARNVDTRVLMTAKERRNVHPKYTQDLADELQIPVTGPNTATAYGIVDVNTGEILK